VATLHLLGTGAAASDGARTTTMLAVEANAGVLLIDCGGDAAQRLRAHGLEPAALAAIVITHEHADHVAGFPLLLERMWLGGRRDPIDVYGIEPAMAQARRLHDAFDTSAWPGYPSVRYHAFAHEEGAPVLTGFGLHVHAAPGTHSVPTVGLRIAAEGGGVLAYSGDTAYDPAIVRLARGADLLVHEATDESPMHSRVEDAARVALEAGVGRLVLVHLPPGFDVNGGPDRARAAFEHTTIGEDGARFTF
jgi:ribonuclease Z